MFDDPLLLARLQFALTASIHYTFVAFTLGVAPFILFTQLRAVRARDGARLDAVRFWGGLYLINYGMGILSGLVMELQLALNWGGLSDMFGYAFGAPLAVETMAAFFVESTFLGLWIFGWDRMGRWAHWTCFLVVTFTAYLSAYWVLVSNGFLKNPVGFEINDGTAELTDPVAMALNPSALMAFGHVVTSTVMVGGMIVMAVSAYQLSRRRDPSGAFRRSIAIGALMVALATMPTVTFGGTQFALFGQAPPTSGLTYTAAEIATIEGGYELAPAAAAAAFGGEMTMFLSWLAMSVLAGFALLLWLVKRLHVWRWFHWTLIAALVLPYGASIGGWIFRETNRQPWTVVHHLTTADAMSDLSPGAAAASFGFFTAAFLALGAVTLWLLARFTRLGPDRSPLAKAPDTSADDEARLEPVHTF